MVHIVSLPGAEIALGSSVILVGGFLFFLILYILLTSLLVTATFSKKGAILAACGVLSWGALGVQLCWERGHGILRIKGLDRNLFSKPLTRNIQPFDRTEARPSGRTREIPWGSLFPTGLQVLHCLHRYVRLQRVSADITLGLPNTAETGIAFGYFHAIKGILSPVSSVSLQMEPDFDRTVCEGEISCTIEVRYPLLLGFRLLQIGLQKPVRNIWLRRNDQE